MSGVTAELLDSCLAEARGSRVIVEACLAAHPEEAEELSQFLAIVASISPPPPVRPEPGFRARARARLIAAIAAEQESVTNSPGRRFWQVTREAFAALPQLIARRTSMPAFVFALILALTSAAGGGVVHAARGALPGDTLFGVKLALEEVQSALARQQAALAAAQERAPEQAKDALARAAATAERGLSLVAPRFASSRPTSSAVRSACAGALSPPMTEIITAVNDSSGGGGGHGTLASARARPASASAVNPSTRSIHCRESNGPLHGGQAGRTGKGVLRSRVLLTARVAPRCTKPPPPFRRSPPLRQPLRGCPA